METALIEILTNAGAIGVCIALLIYMWRKDKLNLERDQMFNKTLNNHLEHAEKAEDRHTEATKSLTEILISIKGVIRGCPNNKLNKK